MPSLPIGTVTFLFTDIEGSTRLWEQFPAEMGAALARHDALLREAIERNDGAVFATGGDAFCAAFHTASAALSAARVAQLALASEPWPEPVRIRVRMALHTGTAEVRDNDYFGQPLNRVARLLAAGHGGQVLLSLATQELVHDGLPVGLALRDLGERRLKDLIRPERVYQLVAPDLPAEFPPLKTLDARAHNLPIQLTSFVGREREMREVKTLLRGSRLITLTGAGGAGKTRLSLQVGADLIDDFADGAWFVELAPLTAANLLPQAIATVLGVKEEPGRPLTETLIGHLKDKELLVLLDNCEHVVEDSAQLCQTVLAACARVCILATSREALRVPGEKSYRVPSLAAPDPRMPTPVESLSQYAAVQLFIDRALAVQSTFRVSNANAPAVAGICHELDGIPLAIELAAARLRSLSVVEVSQRLKHCFRLLTGGARTSLPRQQTLRAAIDWSYDLLGAAEQALFRRLSAFAGGWTLEAAEQVCTGEGVGEGEVLDLLASLVDKSLVMPEERDGASRYRMLETVRQYARERLRERSEEAHWQGRHLAYFRQLAEEGEPYLRGSDQRKWLERFETEHDNLRVALGWSTTEGGDVEAGLRLSGALAWFWYVRGYLREGRRWLSALLATGSGAQPMPVRANALAGAGLLARQQGDYSAAWTLFDESLTISRQIGDRRRIASLLNNLGIAAQEQGQYAVARTLHSESLAIQRELRNGQGVVHSLTNLGLIAAEQGENASARESFEECLAIVRERGDQRGIAMALANLGMAEVERGEGETARALFSEALAIFRELKDPWGVAQALGNLGNTAGEQGEHASARALYEESLAIQQELGNELGTAWCLGSIGTLAVEQGDSSRAEKLLVQSLEILRRLEARRPTAFVLEGLASAASGLAALGRAACLLGAAQRVREEVGVPLPPSARPKYDRQVAALRAAFGDNAEFERAWQEGRAMTLDRAIEYALHENAGDTQFGQNAAERE